MNTRKTKKELELEIEDLKRELDYLQNHREEELERRRLEEEARRIREQIDAIKNQPIWVVDWPTVPQYQYEKAPWWMDPNAPRLVVTCRTFE